MEQDHPGWLGMNIGQQHNSSLINWSRALVILIIKIRQDGSSNYSFTKGEAYLVVKSLIKKYRPLDIVFKIEVRQ
jgi:hypothetical protein